MEYHGNFARLVRHGVPFTRLLVPGRQVQQITDKTFHVIGMDTIINFSLRSRVYRFKDYVIIRDCGRYHIFR